jgi:L-ascorbate metabolism protein UlaG (beta-lactamase superfamily)
MILPDPNFLHRGERAYLGYGLWSKRLTEPALAPAQLPPIDVIVLSHLHGDHWDRRSRNELDRGLPVVTEPQGARRLRGRPGFSAAVGLRTWQQHVLSKDSCTLKDHRRSGRALGQLGGQDAAAAGDGLDPGGGGSGQAPDPADLHQWRHHGFGGLDAIAERHGPVDTAVVHVGGTTLPGGFVVTMIGAEAVECLQRIRPRVAVPVHHDDYGVFKSGLDDMRKAVGSAGREVEMRYVRRGESTAL